jgi:hypothetical protein
MAEPASVEPPVSPWWFILFMLGIAGAVLLFLRVVVGVAIDAPTLGLAVACAALIGALRGMWGVVFVLTRPGVETIVTESEVGPALGSKSELREEKLRVLRAIKELEFDHAMGKLSDQDFKQVGDGYRLRAIEVMRALDEDPAGELHPLLREHLAGIGQPVQAEAASEPKPEANPEVPAEEAKS